MNYQSDHIHTTGTLKQKDFMFPDEYSSIINDFEVELHRNRQILDQLTNEWDQLAITADTTVYMTPEWINNWWKHFGDNTWRSLHIITVRHRGNLIAFAPFYQGTTSVYGHTFEKRLQLIGSGGSPNERFGFREDYGISDFLDILVHPDYTAQVARLLAGRLIDETDNVDSILFHQLREDSFVIQHLYPMLKRSSLFLHLKHTDTCPYIDLDGQQSVNGYVKQVKSNARRRFRQTLKAAGPGGQFTVEPVNDSAAIEHDTKTMIELHQQRWNELGFPGVFSDERFELFFKELLFLMKKKNRLWYKKAVDENGTSALRMMIEFNGRYYDYISGFDTASPSSKFRPGYGILLASVEDALKSGISRIELLRGEEGYKYDFTSVSVKNYAITIRKNKRKRAGQKLMHLLSLAYVTAAKEVRVFRVNRHLYSWPARVVRYVKFRTRAVREKLAKI